MTQPNSPFDFSEYSSSRTPSDDAEGFEPSTWGPHDAGNPSPFGAPDPASYGGGPAAGVFAEAPVADEITVAKPPVLWLALAAAAALASLLVAGIALSAPSLALVGWALAGPIAIGLLAVFTLVDTGRRAAAVYAEPTWAKPAYWGVLAVAGVGILLSAWRIAEWIGRL